MRHALTPTDRYMHGLRRIPAWVWVIAATAAAHIASQWAPAIFDRVPAAWNFGLRAVIDDVQRWVILNRATHVIFLYGFEPVSAAVDAALRGFEALLLAPPWTVIVAIVALLAWQASGLRLAAACAAGLFVCGLFGLWEQTMQTLALMLAAVSLSVVIGIPIGVMMAVAPRAARIVRPILDAMQTMPAFVYLVPVVLFFGIARVPAVLAAMVYAIPPVIRLTAHGVATVETTALEAARAFGATRGQILRTVQIPLAIPSILAGVNQTIMMAVGMVVIAAMIGAGGLGREVFLSLQRLQVGQAFEAGLAIVIVAMMLDRISSGMQKLDVAEQRARRALRIAAVFVAGAAIAFVVGVVAFPYNTFPLEWRFLVRESVDGAVRWVRDEFYWATGGFSDLVTIYLLNVLRDVFTGAPWLTVTALFTATAARVGGFRLAAATAVCLAAIAGLGMWAPAMDTLSQILLATAATIMVALPAGIAAAHFTWLSRILRPINDFLQTVPTFVFLVPVMMLFNIGRMPGLIAAVLYAVPVGIKLTELGIGQVSVDVVEAARAFGSTRWQMIRNVQLPLARRSLALAINQMIMMVLAMTVISGMVGGAGLGLEAVTGLARNQTGQGMEAGISIVLMAIALDRLTQAWANKGEAKQP
jgi:glycine betaine/proline transport system permease protein